MELSTILRTCIEQDTWIQATLSQLRSKSWEQAPKVTIKPIELKGKRYYQFSYFYANKVYHENLKPQKTLEQTEQLLGTSYRQGLLQSVSADYQILISQKGKIKILKKEASKQKLDAAHNRQKKYVIDESKGQAVPFLVELGVMTSEGKVVRKKYDKFKQINRFLEMIRDVVPYLPTGRTIQIIDFGCGKSYLTFALYHYLVELEGLDVQITGLDLKEDVIRHCNDLAQSYGYSNLQFKVGDIAKYEGRSQVDMVVSLHACDTATDAALEKAVRWEAGVILTVPCCQHELATQIDNDLLQPMLRHGIIKERFSSLATDAIRAQLLSILGYKTQMLEFIDVEHTPKNILIRAIKEKKPQLSRQQQQMKEYTELRDFLKVQPYLERALQDLLKEYK